MTDDIETLRRASSTAIDEVHSWRIAGRTCIAMFFVFSVATVWVVSGVAWGLFFGAIAFACSAVWCATRTSVAIDTRDMLMVEFKKMQAQAKEKQS